MINQVTSLWLRLTKWLLELGVLQPSAFDEVSGGQHSFHIKQWNTAKSLGYRRRRLTSCLTNVVDPFSAPTIAGAASVAMPFSGGLQRFQTQPKTHTQKASCVCDACCLIAGQRKIFSSCSVLQCFFHILCHITPVCSSSLRHTDALSGVSSSAPATSRSFTNSRDKVSVSWLLIYSPQNVHP